MGNQTPDVGFRINFGLAASGERGEEAGADRFANLGVERLDVFFDQFASVVGVAISQSVKNDSVFVDRVGHEGDVSEIEVPEPVGLGVQHVETVEHEVVARCPPHDLVADAVGSEMFDRRHARGVVSVKRRDHLVPLLFGASNRSQPSGVGLEHGTGFEQHRKLRYLDTGYEHAPTGDHRHEVLTLQALQGFSDRRSANAESLLEVVLS
jgi:hypothetical protein